jgi:hypothetical protein
MEDSNQQFQELLAHLVARANKMLAEQKDIHPLSLALVTNGTVEVGVGVTERQDQVPSVLDAMQQALVDRVRGGGVQATCIAYPNHQDDTVIALLENKENFCATVVLPVLVEPSWSLDTENMAVTDGAVYIFPIRESGAENN